MRQTQALISIHAMSPSPTFHRAATAARMKAAPPSIRPKISAQNTTSLNRNRFNIIPDIMTRRDRLSHQQDDHLPRLLHLDTSSLSTTRLHPSLLVLSPMSATDPVASISIITSSSALSKHQLQQLFALSGSNNIHNAGASKGTGTGTHTRLPDFTVVMLQYQELSAWNLKVRNEGEAQEMMEKDEHVDGKGDGNGNEDHKEEGNREKEFLFRSLPMFLGGGPL